jgi:hypothetical protein
MRTVNLEVMVALAETSSQEITPDQDHKQRSEIDSNFNK